MNRTRVLVVDDDPFARMLLERQVRSLGVAAVQTCENGPLALDALRTETPPFDVLVVDLNMPDMDGVEFLRHLRELRFGGRVVLVSGEDSRILESVARLAAAYQLQVPAALRKPVAAADLKRALAGGRAGDGAVSLPKSRWLCSRAELITALEEDQFVNAYQPQVDLATGALVGVEALARWQHPREGLLPPGSFIPAIEKQGLAGDFTRRVLSRAMADARTWLDAELDVRVSVNVSMPALLDLAFPDEVAAQAARFGVAADRLVLEITESQVAQEPMLLLDIASRLRLKHVGLSIDDFGTGYSSLAQLRDLPFDELKLDRSFVRGSAASPPLRTILAANIDMAHQLGIRCVAEGIEDESDWAFLQKLGCDLAQGYLIGLPMRAARLLQWSRARRGSATALASASGAA